MAVLPRDQLLAARAGVIGCGPEDARLPTARVMPSIVSAPRSPKLDARKQVDNNEVKASHQAKALTAIAQALMARRDNNEIEEVHTPKGCARKGSEDPAAAYETPPKAQRPSQPTLSADAIGKAACKSLNAYANEFVPGVKATPTESSTLLASDPFFASVCELLAAYQGEAADPKLVMPPVLPAIPLADLASLNTWACSLDAAYKDPSGMEKPMQQSHPEDVFMHVAPEVSPHVPGAELDISDARTLTITACLLNFFFQSPILQTTQTLLEIIETQLKDRCPAAGPWSKLALQNVSFSVEHLAKLDQRLSMLLKKIPPELLSLLADATRGLNLRWQLTPQGGCWRFRNAPELRRIITARSGAFDFRVLAMSFQHEEGQLAPSQMTMDRFFRFRPPGIACFQGLDVRAEAEVASGLAGKGYDAKSARNCGSANTIAWDRRLWTLVASHEEWSAIAVDLAFKGGTRVRFACLRPTLAECGSPKLRDLLRSSMPTVVCADLSLVGGAASAALVPGLAGLRSAMFEILGQEVSVPLPRPDGAPVSEANPGAGLVQPLQDLWEPSAMFFLGLETVSALSEHSEGYLATMSNQSARIAFPGGQAPLLAEFNFNGQ